MTAHDSACEQRSLDSSNLLHEDPCVGVGAEGSTVASCQGFHHAAERGSKVSELADDHRSWGLQQRSHHNTYKILRKLVTLSKYVFKILTFIFFLYGFDGCNPLKILRRQHSSSRGNLEV